MLFDLMKVKKSYKLWDLLEFSRQAIVFGFSWYVRISLTQVCSIAK